MSQDYKPGDVIPSTVYFYFDLRQKVVMGCTFSLPEEDYILLGTVEAQFTLPADFNPARICVIALRKQLEQTREIFEARTAEINKQISEFLAIEG